MNKTYICDCGNQHPDTSGEPFSLTNAPAGRTRKPIAAPRSGVQLALLSGLDCLPGQQDLFDVDGASRLPAEPAPGYSMPPCEQCGVLSTHWHGTHLIYLCSACAAQFGPYSAS